LRVLRTITRERLARMPERPLRPSAGDLAEKAFSPADALHLDQAILLIED
jgi:hypothetical protein